MTPEKQNLECLENYKWLRVTGGKTTFEGQWKEIWRYCQREENEVIRCYWNILVRRGKWLIIPSLCEPWLSIPYFCSYWWMADSWLLFHTLICMLKWLFFPILVVAPITVISGTPHLFETAQNCFLSWTLDLIF